MSADNGVTEIKFQKLTPASCENMKYYNEALDFVFKEEDLLNVAVTGSYGAGKSSVIKTYEHNASKKFIYISLAHFEDINQKEENEDKEKKENLEQKIINQFVHKIDTKMIPQTRFEVKREITKKDIRIHSVILSILFVLAIYIFNYDYWKGVYSQLDYCTIKNLLWFTSSGYTYLAAVIISLSIVIFYLNKCINNQFYKPILKKIKFKGNEIEIAEKTEESYFDKHLDEILYIFKNSKADAIIFEDIDRYNSNKIFSKLREINCLVNKQCEEVSIRFIYLLRDDIFTSKDRTKFFDFIVPIVPVLDSSNSYDQMLNIFKDGGIVEKFENSFLERISLYIDDMRILKNIYNEYVAYNSRIQSTELDPNKLLSIIIYKNIFPKDFADMQLNRGFVHNIFTNRDIFVNNLKRDIDKQINCNDRTVEKLKNEQLNDIDELDALFLNFSENLIVDGMEESKFKSRVEFIKEVKKNPNSVQYYSNGYNSGYRLYDIKSELEKMSTDQNYISRKKIIDEKLNYGIHNLEIENRNLSDKKMKIDSYKLKDLINKENIDELFTMNIDVENKEYSFILDSQYYPLIKYLIRNGYINETYFDYLTYFYGNSLSRNDKVFLRSVTDEIAKQPLYKLDNPEAVVSKLRKSDFEKGEVLNYNLVSYLIESNHEYLSALFMQIKKNKNFYFIFNFIDYMKNDSSIIYFRFIKQLNASWKELFDNLIITDTITMEQKYQYIIDTFYTIDTKAAEENLKDMNIERSTGAIITEYIEKNKNFLDIENPDTAFIISGLKILDVHFKEINYDKCNKELFKYLYKENLYKINSNMISCILRNVYNLKNENDYFTKNYSLVSSNKNEPLYIYINKNMNEYMEVILQECESSIMDNEDSIARILNDENIDCEYRNKYLSKLETPISDINKINQEFWEELLIDNKAEYSVHNIISYYFELSHDLHSILIEFINGNNKQLSFEIKELKNIYSDYNLCEFYDEVIAANKLDTSKYEMIMKGYHKKYEEFKLKNLEKDKLDKLIGLGIIDMSQHNIKFVRENCRDSLIKFIVKNINTYIECLDEKILDKEEIMKIVAQSSVSDNYKISLLEKYPYTFSLINHDFSEELKLFILKNKFDIEDLFYLIERYNESSQSIKSEIARLCAENIAYIYTKKLYVCQELLKKIIFSSPSNREDKKKLIYQNLDRLNISEIKIYMSRIGETQFARLLEGCRPKIVISDINKKILDYYKGKEWITNYGVDKRDSSYYKAIGKKIDDESLQLEEA